MNNSNNNTKPKKQVSGYKMLLIPFVSFILIVIISIVVGFIYFKNSSKTSIKESLAQLKEMGYPTTLEELNNWHASSLPDHENGYLIALEAVKHLVKWPEIYDGESPQAIKEEILSIKNSKRIPDDRKTRLIEFQELKLKRAEEAEITTVDLSRNPNLLPWIGNNNITPNQNSYSTETVDAMRLYIKDNNAAVEKLHQLTSYNSGHMKVDYFTLLDSPQPPIIEIMDCSKLLMIELALHCQDNNIEKAWHTLLSLYGLANALDNHPLLIGYIAKLSLHRTATEGLTMVLGQFTYTNDQYNQMSKFYAQDLIPHFKSTIATARVWQYTIMKESISSSLQNNYNLMNYIERTYFLFQERLWLENTISYIKAFDSPDSKKVELFARIYHNTETTFIPKKYLIFTMMWEMEIHNDIDAILTTKSLNQMAITAIEIEKYHNQHKKYPKDLTELQKDIPLDIYSNNHFIYHSNEKQYTLYSYGKDDYLNQNVPHEKLFNAEKLDEDIITFTVHTVP